MRVLTYAVAIFFILSCPALAWRGNVKSVYDGDTLRVLPEGGGEVVKIRLYGIDTPEFAARDWKIQPFAQEATELLRVLLPEGVLIVVDDRYEDKYGRTVANIITLPDGKIAQEELLKAGLAWVYPQYCNGCQQWKRLQEDARKNRFGLWEQDSPMPPWQWRKSGWRD